MKVASVLLFAALLSTPAATPQQHAPLPEQCRADAAVWDLTQMPQSQRDAVTFREAMARYKEMSDCASVDIRQADTYFQRTVFYSAIIGRRYEDFIKRHDLMQQFLDEDSQGLR